MYDSKQQYEIDKLKRAQYEQLADRARLAAQLPPEDSTTRKVAKAVGRQLINWGEQLQGLEDATRDRRNMPQRTPATAQLKR